MRIILAFSLLTVACASQGARVEIDEASSSACPLGDETLFSDLEACATGKSDTGYVTSLDAREVEVTLEGEVDAGSSSKERAPLKSAQFALSSLRWGSQVYIQSLAEQFSAGAAQVEWWNDGSWQRWDDLSWLESRRVTRYRLRDVNAVVMQAKERRPAVGSSWTAVVPKDPMRVGTVAGRACVAPETRSTPHDESYWYYWRPETPGCLDAVPSTKATATVSRVLPAGTVVFPEYDKLAADGRIDVVVFFGMAESTADDDYGFILARQFERLLRPAGFTPAAAPVGRRHVRSHDGLTVTVDVLTPAEFSGLGDDANAQHFRDAVNSHEVVVFNGHSMLGASDVWADERLYADPSRYQIFFYNGCLGYEYYVTPLLEGKGDAANVDIVTNVLSTPFSVFATTSGILVSMLVSRADEGGHYSWQSILGQLNEDALGGAYYGASAVRDNAWRPPGR